MNWPWTAVNWLKGWPIPGSKLPPYADAIVPVKVYSSMFDMIGIARRLIQRAQKPVRGEKLAYALSGHL